MGSGERGMFMIGGENFFVGTALIFYTLILYWRQSLAVGIPSRSLGTRLGSGHERINLSCMLHQSFYGATLD